MDMELQKLATDLAAEGGLKGTFSSSTDEAVAKVKVRPVSIKGETLYQFEEFRGTQAFHKNVAAPDLEAALMEYLDGRFHQAELETDASTVHVLISKKGKATVKKKKKAVKVITFVPEHNRTKNYLLEEGTPVPFLVELGVMSPDGKVLKAKYDKFKQINRFLEFADDVFPELPKDKTLTILDFGCGKSYLTFALYHYLKVMKGRDVRIIGLDLKKDVINHCNSLAEQLGYTELKFICGDVADYEGVDTIDMMVTLHACDTATDYALAKAVRWGAKVILSVPCCQHELNRTIANDDMSSLLKYGIIKEKAAALFTDALRGNILEAEGYGVQLLEFIDMEHTPKNILIRAVKNGSRKEELYDGIAENMAFLNADLTLYKLLTGEIKD